MSDQGEAATDRPESCRSRPGAHVGWSRPVAATLIAGALLFGVAACGASDGSADGTSPEEVVPPAEASDTFEDTEPVTVAEVEEDPASTGSVGPAAARSFDDVASMGHELVPVVMAAYGGTGWTRTARACGDESLQLQFDWDRDDALVPLEDSPVWYGLTIATANGDRVDLWFGPIDSSYDDGLRGFEDGMDEGPALWSIDAYRTTDGTDLEVGSARPDLDNGAYYPSIDALRTGGEGDPEGSDPDVLPPLADGVEEEVTRVALTVHAAWMDGLAAAGNRCNGEDYDHIADDRPID